MMSNREFPVESDAAAVVADAVVNIGRDERRMQVRAYNHWVSLLEGRDYPSIRDLDRKPGAFIEWAPNSVLLDVTAGPANATTPYIGAALQKECGIDEELRDVADVPRRSVLSRLTDHYMQVIAKRAPIGFEAEFSNQRGDNLCYRAILMPFSSHGDMVECIYGVINWKTVADQAALTALTTQQGKIPSCPVPGGEGWPAMRAGAAV